MTQPPRPVGTPPRIVDITGHVIPWNDGPVLLTMAEADDNLYLPVFSTVEKLTDMMMLTEIAYQSIKRIDDRREFLDSLPADVRVIIDPHFHESGRVRYTEILR